jgi:hypothetical protein
METGEMVLDVPAFATVRREHGVTVLRIRAVWSRWLPITTLALLALTALGFAFAMRAAQAESAGGWTIAAAIIAGVCQTHLEMSAISPR